MLDPTSAFLKTALKYSRLVVASKITPDEYAYNLLACSVSLSDFDDATVRAVAESVPELARKQIAAEVSMILATDYRHPELCYGGPGPSHDERERIRQLHETRVRAFADALGSALNLGSDASNT